MDDISDVQSSFFLSKDCCCIDGAMFRWSNSCAVTSMSMPKTKVAQLQNVFVCVCACVCLSLCAFMLGRLHSLSPDVSADGRTALHYACSSRRGDAARALLETPDIFAGVLDNEDWLF